MVTEPAILASGLVVVASLGLAVLLARTGRRRHLPMLAVVASAVLVVVATGLPTHWSDQSGAAWRLAPGHGGLGKAGLQLLGGSPGAAAELLVLNGLLYVPLGAALAWRWPDRPELLVVPVTVSTVMETVQYLALDRVAATDDVLVNVAGAVAGWLLVTGWRRRAARARPSTAVEDGGGTDVGRAR